MPSRHLLLPLALAVALAAAAVACSSGGGGGSAGLTSGVYAYSGSGLAPDGCKLGPAAKFDGVVQNITVSGSSLTFETVTDPVVFTNAASFSATLTGNSFQTATLSHTIDWTSTAAQISSGLPPLSRGYPCVEADLYGVTGAVTGANAFFRSTDVRFTVATGTAGACTAALGSELGISVAFPCQSVLTQQATRQ